MSKYLSEVPEVDIDGKGVFKYMLLNIHDKATDDYKPVVRGYLSAAWHDDVFEQTKEQVKKYSDLEVKSLGGGRIQHDPEIKSIRVYGYSQGYGQADHSLAVDLLKTKYPDYDITWTNDGY
ncbi:PREDICTED: 14 kDa phosphohistidine phosphatase-like isoform X4 [Polistes dominula]|nr:PREDICTED: 14 kDa phosphohistidine phosphatase-like isoform X4 [Polistes dominula]